MTCEHHHEHEHFHFEFAMDIEFRICFVFHFCNRFLATGNQIGSNGGPPRKNHPLCHETIRWKSDVPLTEGQLRSKRDEFWDTAPAFDGRKEIWDALRAATIAAESLDFQLSQAILDGANISVPNG